VKVRRAVYQEFLDEVARYSKSLSNNGEPWASASAAIKSGSRQYRALRYNIPRGGGAEFGRGFLPVRTVRVGSGQQWGLRIQDLS
jgi:hypothetical protein